MKGKNFKFKVGNDRIRTGSEVEGEFRRTLNSPIEKVSGRFEITQGEPSIWNKKERKLFYPVKVTKRGRF